MFRGAGARTDSADRPNETGGDAIGRPPSSRDPTPQGLLLRSKPLAASLECLPDLIGNHALVHESRPGAAKVRLDPAERGPESTTLGLVGEAVEQEVRKPAYQEQAADNHNQERQGSPSLRDKEQECENRYGELNASFEATSRILSRLGTSQFLRSGTGCGGIDRSASGFRICRRGVVLCPQHARMLCAAG